MLTALVSTISNSQIFFSEKISVAFANAKTTHIFSAKLLTYVYAIFNDESLTIRLLTTSLVLNNWAQMI